MLAALLISFRRVDLQSGDQRDVSDAIPDVSESAREDLKGEAELPAEGVAEWLAWWRGRRRSGRGRGGDGVGVAEGLEGPWSDGRRTEYFCKES